MKDDRNGMVSLMDAAMFVTLLTIVSVSLFAFVPIECMDEPMAKTICDDLISIELRASDVLETQDSDIYPISDLIASGLSSGRTERLEHYIHGAIEGLVPANCGYGLTVGYCGRSMEFARAFDMQVSSDYATEAQIVNGGRVSYHLAIYGW